MAKSSGRRGGRRILPVLLALILLAVLGYAGYRILARESSPLEAAIVLTGAGDAAAYPAENGFVLVEGNRLSRRDGSARELFAMELPESGMKATASSGLVAAWSDDRLIVANSSGTVLQHQQLATPLIMVRCGQDQYAVSVWEDGQRVVYVYKAMDGSLVERFLMPYQSVLDMGFYGGNLSQFWLLTLDSHYTVPSAQVKNLQPGKALTANISISGQVVYTVVPGDKTFYTVGTHSIQKWDATGSQTAEKSVYGWTLLDRRADADGGMQFLMGPASTEDTDVPLNALWYIRSGADGSTAEQRISLPAGCSHAVLGRDRILAFAQEGFYTVSLKTGTAAFHKTEQPIAQVTTLTDAGAVVMRMATGDVIWMPVD